MNGLALRATKIRADVYIHITTATAISTVSIPFALIFAPAISALTLIATFILTATGPLRLIRVNRCNCQA